MTVHFEKVHLREARPHRHRHDQPARAHERDRSADVGGAARGVVRLPRRRRPVGRHLHRRRRSRVLRRQRPRRDVAGAAGRRERRQRGVLARAVRRHHAQLRVLEADDRRDQRLLPRRRPRDGAVVRHPHRRRARDVRPAGGDARDHRRRRRHAAAAARSSRSARRSSCSSPAAGSTRSGRTATASSTTSCRRTSVMPKALALAEADLRERAARRAAREGSGVPGPRACRSRTGCASRSSSPAR